MDITLVNNLISDHTFQVVILGSLVLGITAGALGVFAVLRQQSLLGDAISHATLPGVVGAFLLTQSKSPLVLLIGAGLAGWTGTLLINLITANTRIKRDAALGIILSFFFGFGLMLLTIAQKLPTATKAGLDKFLFGNAATLLKSDVEVMVGLSIFILVGLLICWKEFKIIVFDEDFAQSLGMRVRLLDLILTTMMVMTIVIGLQTVGVVLMSAMLVAPAAASRQWTNKLEVMVMLAALFGSVSGVGGAVISSVVPRIPTGPMIVVFLSIFVFFSLFLAPQRGLVWDWIRAYQHREKIRMHTMLKNLLLFSEINTDPFHSHNLSALQAIGLGFRKKTMQELSQKGWVKESDKNFWALTPKGLEEARRLTREYEAGMTRF